jgi:dipeptidyl aminopeptidase/acylaminoacyl peptidase
MKIVCLQWKKLFNQSNLMNQNTKNTFWVSLMLLLFAGSLVAQEKKMVTPDDYKLWENLGSTDLSPDGNWVAYSIGKQEDNDTLFVSNMGGTLHKLPFASGGIFSADNKWFAYRIGVSYKEQEAAREGNKPIDFKMGLLNLQTGEKENIPNLARMDFSKDGKFLAIYIAKPRDSKEKGSTLLLRDLSKGTTRNIGNVTEFSFNKKGDRLAYITENNAFKSVELINLSNASVAVVASDTSSFSKLTWHKEGNSLAFYQEMKHKDFEEESQLVHHYTNIYASPALKTLDPTKTAGFPEAMRIFASSNLMISDDQQTLFFGLQEWTRKDTSKVKPKNNEKLPGVDVWHYQDNEIQPRQKITYNQDKNRSHLSAWWPAQNKFVRIADDNQPETSLTGNHKQAIAFNSNDYKPAFKEDYADFYLVDVATGSKKKILEKQLSGFNAARTSPDGKYLSYFKDQNWWIYDIAANTHTNITKDLGIPLHNINYDGPGTAGPFGNPGWTKGDREFLVYDQFDIWAISPDGKTRKKLTDGRKDQTIFRIQRLDFEEPAIDLTKPQILAATGDKSKKTGYYKLDPKAGISQLIFEDMAIGRITKAKDADKYLYVKQAYHISPTLYHTAADLKNPREVIRTNKHQDQFHWGKSELITYKNADGKELQGALFYPANYEPGKQYPMVTYIYEILSNTVHFYTNPSERSAYNTANFTSDGYFVFRPDIVYDLDDPGVSAVKCVVPAVEEVLKTGMIDRSKLALMGHSWGAYQTSFIITQTDLFAGAVAGAPLTDMISMSLSIYWNTGTPDQKIFETSQGRFTGPWYEQYEAHKRNSPIYGAQNIKTPLLVAFGDKDGAVDWQQGIEMYGTMRRMEKPHVLLVYEGENHGLAKRENQMDYYNRTNDWFNTFVLKKDAPKWITDGISYMEKMKAMEKAKPAAAGAGQR